MSLHTPIPPILSSSNNTYTGTEGYITVQRSLPLEGNIHLSGAKNSSLVIIASLLLTKGVSVLKNVPASHDIFQMIYLMEHVGAHIHFDIEENILTVDTTHAEGYSVPTEVMNKFRASVLMLGPLLARHKKALFGFPGGCSLGTRPIDYHLKNLEKMGVTFIHHPTYIEAHAEKIHPQKLLLEYQSMGATKNLMMVATLTPGITKICNAAFEPEVLDFIEVLRKMGAQISFEAPGTIVIRGVEKLHPVEHFIMYDRLEAGSLLLAGAITGGHIHIPEAPAHSLELFLMKLQEMGHSITVGPNEEGVTLKSTKKARAVSIKTAPHPCFPTDLQAPMMTALTLSQGASKIQETVFENRFAHVEELNKLGAKIKLHHGVATIDGVEELIGTHVEAHDIRASCALVLAGLAAQGTTIVTNIHHWKRGYESLELKLQMLGASISLVEG
jgi:UDP-N-acetylglucosamine 1-carboxyvinyltransferase